MALILILAAALIGFAVALTIRTLSSSATGVGERIAQIASYGFADAGNTVSVKKPLVRERLDTLVTSIGEIAERRVDRSREHEIRRQLSASGLYRTTPRTFLGYRLIATGAFSLGWVALNVLAGSNVLVVLFGALCLGALGWVGPTFWLKRRAANRLQQIDHEIPELVDLLVTAVEGGLGFGGSLELAVRSLEGPLGEELRLALQEQSLGLTTNAALQNMLDRVDTLSVRSFVQAIVQGESLGVSVGKILRDLAREMRSRRRQAAEERAHKAGTKIIFPVAVCIFPALFVVALGPMVIYLARTLGG